MPTLVKVRRKSRITVCASNLHQIGTAIQAYASDNNSWMPGSDFHADACWWRYLGGTERLQPIGSYPVYLDYNPLVFSGTAWACPFVSSELEDLVRFPSFTIDKWSNHYGMNYNLNLKALKIRALRSEMGLLADAAPLCSVPPGSAAVPFSMSGQFNAGWSPGLLGLNTKFAPWPINRSGGIGSGVVTTLHGGCFNMGYPDGHVASQQSVTSQDLVL